MDVLTSQSAAVIRDEFFIGQAEVSGVRYCCELCEIKWQPYKLFLCCLFMFSFPPAWAKSFCGETTS